MQCFPIFFVGRIAITHVSGNLFFGRTVTLCHGVTFGFDVVGVNVLHQIVVKLKGESAWVSVLQLFSVSL